LDKLRDPKIAQKFAPLLMLEDLEGITIGFNSVMIDTANEVLGEERMKNKPWVIDNILKLFDTRRE